MRFDIFTILPGIMAPYLQASVLGRASQAGLLDIHLHDIRQYATDRHHTTDDVPYGGGGGMIMKPEPVFAAVEHAYEGRLAGEAIILLTPQGRQFSQALASELARLPRLGLICGRYEGVDERIREHLATDEISIGDFVLTGGELPALLVVDAIARLLPGVLGCAGAGESDSYASGLLEHPHYTRPASFRSWEVPPVLLSGDHARIARWRRQQSLLRTLERRPDLLDRVDLDESDQALLAVARKGGGESV
jgi:tRNA (guanine37-N1)-methyltransferase